MNYPSFIELHRCLGGCQFQAPSLMHCAVSQQTSVQVNYTEFRLENGGGRKSQVKTLQNHTNCKCQCRIQEHHCVKEKERYDENECKCVCKELNCTDKQVKKELYHERLLNLPAQKIILTNSHCDFPNRFFVTFHGIRKMKEY